MSGKVTIPAVSLDPHAGGGSQQPSPHARGGRRDAGPEQDGEADLRLVIEVVPGLEGEDSAIYKVIDRRSGRIVSQLDREQVLRLKERTGYAAGDLFSGKA